MYINYKKIESEAVKDFFIKRKRDFNVLNFDDISEYDLSTLYLYKIDKLSEIVTSVKEQFIGLLILNPFKRKEAILFLKKFNDNKSIVAYLYRYLLSSASFYGVPSVMINFYVAQKKQYKTNKDSRTKEKLETYFVMLMFSTIEMIKKANTRTVKFIEY